jgi:hypothetical protein
MDTVKLRTDIKHATECLYQNRGQDGLEAVRNLLPQFQEMIQAIYAGADSARALEFLEVLKTLIENYHAGDGGLPEGIDRGNDPLPGSRRESESGEIRGTNR